MGQIKCCRMCKSKNIEKFLDLGFTPLADNFLTKNQLENSEVYYPLNVCTCKECGFIQLGYIVSPELMFNENYPYESSITKTGRNHFFNMAKEICQEIELPKKSLVVDIGSNVGVLLQGFKKQGMDVIGIEPSKNIAKIAIKNKIPTIPDFFNEKSIKSIIKKKKNASVITATNVFAHVDDLHSFMKNIKKLLHKNGIFVLESPYVINLIDNLEYDTIYHEHMGYMSIKPLIRFLKKFNMELIDVKRKKIHGGAIRCFIANKNEKKISPSVKELLKLEEDKKIYSIKKLQEFSQKVKKHRIELKKMLYKLKISGKKIAIISAPAKGMTLLNFCNIDETICDYVTEKSRLKIGKYTPGTHIHVKSDDFLIKDKPDYALLLAWNFADEIMKNNEEFRKKGGKFLIPIPHPKII